MDHEELKGFVNICGTSADNNKVSLNIHVHVYPERHSAVLRMLRYLMPGKHIHASDKVLKNFHIKER